MATEEQKKIRQFRAFNIMVAGLAKGLYDLFGDAAIGVLTPMGEEIIEEMEHECGLEIHGEDPETILTELERLLVDEYGFMEKASLKINDETHEIDVICEGCLLWRATQDLLDANMPPLTCIPMMISEAALRKRLGKRAKFVGITRDDSKKLCDIDFHLTEFD